MTIKKRLARSNLVMILIPAAIAAALLLLGAGAAFLLLEKVYLPRLGLSLAALHETGEQLEAAFAGAKAVAAIYEGTVILALLAAVGFTNLYLTRNLFRHISEPLDILTAGVARIRDGDLDSPIRYSEADEFQAACDAVDEMAARLKASLEQQQREQQKKQELIAGMSHDLKSPLTAIRAYTEALLDGVAGDDAARRRYLLTIRAREADIEAMASRLFAFAKMDVSGYPVHIEPLMLRETMRELTDERCAADTDLRLEIPAGLQVMADRELLGRMISNLIENSWKYGGGKNAHIRISAGASDGMAELVFEDDGPGVPAEQLPKLFDAFYRGDAARTAPGEGSGLGLAVVKKAVEAMRGSVRAENGTAGGLKMMFTLPLAKEGENV